MLVGEKAIPPADVAIVVENDVVLERANDAAARLRAAGLVVEVVAAGSPKKRFDKARKENPKAILSFDKRETFQSNLRGDEAVEGEIRRVLTDPVFNL